MRVLGVLVLMAAALAGGAALGWTLKPDPPPPPLPPSGDTPALDSLAATVTARRAALERLPQPTSDEENALRRPRTPSYSKHLEWADSLGVDPLTGEGELAGHLADGLLVPLLDTEFYTVRVLEHSKPFVLPRLRDELDRIGRAFQDELAKAGVPPYRFVVSSALRTSDLQRDLGRTNRNAASGTSSHEYGASVDIVTFRYSLQPSSSDTLDVPFADSEIGRAQRWVTQWSDDLGRAYWDPLFGVMVRVLRERQRSGDLLVLLEAEQPVFHITVADGWE
ncbi:MAG: hypothetical protein Rubg2KO_06010 [Rubricoccaceae bacterium]